MDRWEHAITTHSLGELLSKASSKEDQPQMLYCGSSEGSCFFDQAPSPYLEALVEALDDLGQQGWGLVQVVLREEDMICFWRRKRETP